MATRAERVIAISEQIKRQNELEQQGRKAEEETRIAKLIEAKARLDIYKREVWSGTGIPELFEDISRRLKGGIVEYKFKEGKKTVRRIVKYLWVKMRFWRKYPISNIGLF